MNKISYISTLFVILSFMLLPAYAQDVAVIVNKDNTANVDKAMILKIYKGEMTSWPGGGSIASIDQPEDNPVRSAFSSSIMGKSVANLKALWAQNIFTGKAVPPKVLSSDEEVKKAVSANKNAIGYIKTSSVDDTVKTVVK